MKKCSGRPTPQWKDIDSNALASIDASVCELSLNVCQGGAHPLTIELFNDSESLTITLDTRLRTILVLRNSIGGWLADPLQRKNLETPLRVNGNTYTLHMVLDRCCLEVFAAEGASVVSANYFPLAPLHKLRFAGDDNRLTGRLRALGSIWSGRERHLNP